MLKVTIELCPGGDEERARHLGTAKISNNLLESLDSDGALGSYSVTLSKWGRPNQVWKKGSVSGFNRETKGPWDLLLLSLLAAVGKRNKREIRAFLDSVE